MRQRLRPPLRKQLILSAAIRISVYRGYQHITRKDVARAASTSPALVSHYFPTMETLRMAIMLEAIRLRKIPIVVQGLGVDDELAKSAPDDLLLEAAHWLLGGGSITMENGSTIVFRGGEDDEPWTGHEGGGG